MKEYARVLAIAGSEPLGSAGVQADIKAISACGGYAAGALTCIVNEDTLSVKEVYSLPVDLVVGQVRSVLNDVGACAIKMGMLYSEKLIKELSIVLKDYPDIPKIIDPVMVASGGERLVELNAIEAYKECLFPLATIITPNRREAELLLGKEITEDSMDKDIPQLCQWGNSVIVKSIPSGGNLIDGLCLYGCSTVKRFEKRKIDTKNINGTGCSFSSSISAFVAQGLQLEDAVTQAEKYINDAIISGAEYKFGGGFGPVDHFSKFRNK